MVSGNKSSMVYSNSFPTAIKCFSPRSILYDSISLPLLDGSFHVMYTEFAVEVAFSKTTAFGLEGGVAHDAIALKGPKRYKNRLL